MTTFKKRLETLSRESFSTVRKALQAIEGHKVALDEDKWLYVSYDKSEGCGAFRFEAGEILLTEAGRIAVLARGKDISCLNDESSEDYWMEGSLCWAEWEGLLDIFDEAIAYAQRHTGWVKPQVEEQEFAASLDLIRKANIKTITSFLKRYGMLCVNACDIEEGSFPVVQEDVLEENNTFTLDKITRFGDERVLFEASNRCENSTWDETTISTDALIGIASWLNENERDFAENIIRQNCEDADIDRVKANLEETSTKVIFCDEWIDDGLDSEEDKYLMGRSYDVVFGDKVFHVKLYFGDRTREVTCVEVDAM